MDVFNKFKISKGPIGDFQKIVEGKCAFPKFSGTISNKIKFNNEKVITWSYNNYLGIAGSKELKMIDTNSQKKWGMTFPMGSRMMTGDTLLHEKFENNFAKFVNKESALLLNFGYQGMLSIIDTLLDKNDVVISDEQCHACIIDGIRLHKGKHFIFKHNDISDLEEKLILATKHINISKGGILVITEGVFSMSGAQGKLKEICKLKTKYNFRFLVDDAHGFGVLGINGSGTLSEQKIQNKVDLYFTTFTKSMASFGAVIAGESYLINYFKYNLRSQIFSKSLPMPVVNGLIERLKIIRKANSNRLRLFKITAELQHELLKRKLISKNIKSPITPVVLKMSSKKAMELQAEMVRDYKIYCSIIIYPVVPKNTVIFRLTPTSLHTSNDIEKTLLAFDILFPKYVQ
ncbi:pyridoxal phosphate-dependent aminotransferase family protein [Polaribacter aestuariivivens]|uniref:Pyridoxal phosphate-dependent aminotransferase family protein n=1 Tax=Polaribacter aestuariivivens TaxID=2304626 RepID=A0A5S3NFA1_9FLAO|nr:pyridoxal phosphate-dependent aminotransferase family protein [Polaribacter aestuariivivens]TMM31986.1 pyridoxal phosphate-dependent aminotransferase family protein [Polaribacter aestuariivivens]